MSPREDPLLRLAAARPPDPGPDVAARAAVRVLARIAVLEAGRRASRRRPSGRRLVHVAAVLLVLWLPLATLPAGPTRSLTAAQLEDHLWRTRVAAALGGDDLQRQRVLRGGLPARAALLAWAERGAPHGAQALELLAAAGAPRGRAEVERAVRLARRAPLRAPALTLLAGDLGPAGPAGLGRLLVAVPESEAEIVEALARVAAGGRREAALAALLAGARAGRTRAAGAALALGGAGALDRVLAALPGGDEADAQLLSALRRASPTLRRRLVRLAERGDARALRLAARAGVRDVVPLLAAQARVEDDATARRAVRRLAEMDGVAPRLALARALGGAAAAEARRALETPSDAQRARLEERARTSLRDAPAALDALAAAGAVERLEALARTPRLAPGAVRALAAAPAPQASAALARMARRPALSAASIAALTRRVAAGRGEALDALLDLARGGLDRAVLRSLARDAPGARRVLEAAVGDPLLSPRAGALLRRLRPASAPAGAGRRTARARTVSTSI